VHWDEILDICAEYDISLSIGDGLRPGCIAGKDTQIHAGGGRPLSGQSVCLLGLLQVKIIF